jgi:lysozyme family protein
MSQSNRMASFLATMRWEGNSALSLNKADGGNWTSGKVGVGALVGSKFGVSAPVAARLFPGVLMKDLTADQALTVFLTNYWAPVYADKMLTGVDHCVSDDAYNAGPSSALGRWHRGAFLYSGDAVTTIHAYCALRLSFLESLKTAKIFLPGWSRRVAGVEAESVVMAHGAGAKIPQPAQKVVLSLAEHLATKSNEADDSSRTHGATGVATAMGAGVAAIAVSGAHPLVAGGIGAGGLLAALISYWKSRVQAARRDALGDASAIAHMQS